MIAHFRIDERLIHGQVTTGWLNYLNLTRLIVANDRASRNEIQKQALIMAVPKSIKCYVLDIDSAADILNDPRGKNMRIMLVVGSPQDALRLREKCSEIQEINAVNYGVLTKPTDTTKTILAKRFRCDAEDLEAVKGLIGYGVRLYNQDMPTSPVRELQNI